MKQPIPFIFGMSLLFGVIGTSYAEQAPFVAGKQYETITPTIAIPNEYAIKPGTIQVIEFFSYGCPWCYKLEPTIETWLKHKPAKVVFERIPVVFEQGWATYSKAYFTAKALGVSDKITPAIFNAINKQAQDLTSAAAIQSFFVSQGVNANTFNNAFNYSPQINIEMNQANTMMMAYQIMHIPAFVVDGKYKTDAAMAGGDKNLIPILNFLIAKASKS